MMKSCAAAALAAATISSSVASGRPKAMLARTVSSKRITSWLTTAMCAAQARQGHVPHVLPVDQDGALVDVVEARHEGKQRRFARAGAADQGRGLAGLGHQIDAVEGHGLAVIGEGEVREPDLAARQRSGLAPGRSWMRGASSIIAKVRCRAAAASCTMALRLPSARIGCAAMTRARDEAGEIADRAARPTESAGRSA